MLVGEGHSDGSVGPLDYQITIWWEKARQPLWFPHLFQRL